MYMTNLIVAFVVMLVGAGAAELVRMTCRKQLLTPVRPAARSQRPVALSRPSALRGPRKLELSH